MHGPTAATMRGLAGADPLHGRKGGFQNPADGATPTRVGGSHDLGLGIGKQHRRAIGRQHAESQAWRCRDDRIGARPLLGAPGTLDDDRGGAVNLMRRQEAPRRQSSGHARAVLAHGIGSSLEPKPQLRLA